MGDYSTFITNWSEPRGGIHAYLQRFLASSDATFQHIAVWTLLQLLEAKERKLTELVKSSEEIVDMIQTTADREIDSEDEQDDEDAEGGGDAEIVGLARKCLELLDEQTEKSNP